MFQELMPLLAQRTLLLIVSRVGADEIRLNIIPQRVKSTEADQNDALRTPLSISGTAKEVDEALPAQLVEFVGAHLGLSSTLKSVKEQIDAAAKAARESARKQIDSKTVPRKAAPTDAGSLTNNTTTVAGQPREDPASTGPVAETTGSLFAT